MKAYTLEEFTSLPAAYGIGSDVGEYVDYYGREMRQAYIQAYVAFAYNSYYHVTYGLVGLMMLVALGLRFLNSYCARNGAPAWLDSTRGFFAKHFGLASVLNGQASEPHAVFGVKAFTVQIPTRVHSIIIFLYVLFNTLVAFLWYEPLVPNLWYQDLGYHFTFYLRGFADRTGIIAIAATPLALVLAGRNSPIAAMTGASYATLQIYHRWVSRAAVGHAISHSIAYSLMEGLYGLEPYREEFKYAYWNWGVAATVGGGFLAFGSFRWLREKAYEAFLLFHIISAIAWVVGCYYHVWLLDPHYSYLKYIYGAIAFWGFDRFVRWARLAYLNFSFFGSKHGSVKRAPLAAEGYVSDCGEYVCLRVTMARAWPRKMGGAGTYVFLSSPSMRIWENHPFTISWPSHMPATDSSAPSSSRNSGRPSPVSPDSDKEKAFSFGNDASTTRWSDQSASENDASFEVLIKKYSGFTKRLSKALAKGNLAPGQTEKVKILVEVPYGEAVDLSHVDTLLLVAGGSGIAASTAHLGALARDYANGTLRTKRCVLVWSVRSLATADVILPYLDRLQSLLPAGFLTLYLYHSGAACEGEKDISVLSKFKPFSTLCTVELRTGRPYLPEHLDTLAPGGGEKSVTGAGEKVALSACGPTGMCDAARETVRSRLGRDGWTASNLEFHDEVFTW
ncbi:hypothetical protein JCM8097_005268 [Rhodosporidiobolus ruineniae]